MTEARKDKELPDKFSDTLPGLTEEQIQQILANRKQQQTNGTNTDPS